MDTILVRSTTTPIFAFSLWNHSGVFITSSYKSKWKRMVACSLLFKNFIVICKWRVFARYHATEVGNDGVNNRRIIISIIMLTIWINKDIIRISLNNQLSLYHNNNNNSGLIPIIQVLAQSNVESIHVQICRILSSFACSNALNT